jgi:hypothetical protein
LAARTPAEAIRGFLGPLASAISCVTKSIFVERRHFGPTYRPREFALSESPVRLGGVRLGLSVRIGYRLIETPGERRPWSVDLVAYEYRLEDDNSREILSYHWHPEGRVTVPHLHLGAGAADGRLRPDLAGAHLPTGPIALQDVLRLAIAELGVRPTRPDWDDILRRSREAYEG